MESVRKRKTKRDLVDGEVRRGRKRVLKCAKPWDGGTKGKKERRSRYSSQVQSGKVRLAR